MTVLCAAGLLWIYQQTCCLNCSCYHTLPVVRHTNRSPHGNPSRLANSMGKSQIWNHGMEWGSNFCDPNSSMIWMIPFSKPTTSWKIHRCLVRFPGKSMDFHRFFYVFVEGHLGTASVRNRTLKLVVAGPCPHQRGSKTAPNSAHHQAVCRSSAGGDWNRNDSG